MNASGGWLDGLGGGDRGSGAGGDGAGRCGVGDAGGEEGVGLEDSVGLNDSRGGLARFDRCREGWEGSESWS